MSIRWSVGMGAKENEGGEAQIHNVPSAISYLNSGYAKRNYRQFWSWLGDKLGLSADTAPIYLLRHESPADLGIFFRAPLGPFLS